MNLEIQENIPTRRATQRKGTADVHRLLKLVGLAEAA